MAFAKAAGPPAALMACCNAVSLFLRTDDIQQYFMPEVKHCISGHAALHNKVMLDAKELGRRLTKAMDEADPPVTGAALASECGVTPQAVSGWRKTGRLGKRHLPTIIRLTGKSAEYFLSETVPSITKNGHYQPWLVEKVIDPEQFQVVFRTWQDARSTDRENLVAIARAARKAHGARNNKKRTS